MSGEVRWIQGRRTCQGRLDREDSRRADATVSGCGSRVVLILYFTL